MYRIYVSLSDVHRTFLSREATRSGRTMTDLLRQYIDERPEFVIYVTPDTQTGVSEATEDIANEFTC